LTGKPARGRVVSALRLAFAAALLALVAANLPWRDRLLYETGDASRTFAGRIEGDWKQDRIRFRFADAQPSGGLPGEWHATGLATLDLDLARSETTTWRPGLPTVFGDMDASGIAIAFALFAVGISLTNTRWWRLLAAAGCPTRWWQSLRLTFLGFFFNLVVPGLTGGDLVKAVLVARDHPERRAAAAASVLVDRLVGLILLVLLGGAVIVWRGGPFAPLRWPVLIAIAAAVIGVAVYGNDALRRRLGFERLVERLPRRAAEGMRQIDQAVLIYSRHPFEFLLASVCSLGNHLSVIVMFWVLARAFGESVLTFADYVAVVSVGNTISAVPVAPGGWGVGEASFAYLFELLGAEPALGVATSVTFRLLMMAIGLAGGLFLLVGSSRAEIARSIERG
jgi:hypothetical protein